MSNDSPTTWWMKGAIIGIPLGMAFLALLYMGWWAVLAIIAGLFLASMVDWYGQGDGREGCNQHTNCEH